MEVNGGVIFEVTVMKTELSVRWVLAEVNAELASVPPRESDVDIAVLSIDGLIVLGDEVGTDVSSM